MNPVAIEPGRYTVVLEPTAVGNLIQLLAFALNARNAMRDAVLHEAGWRKQNRTEGRK